MELWIRSADGEILLKVNELEIETNMIIAFDGNKYQCLGTYKTKERALEILDEIQNIIKPKMILTKVGEILGETCDGTIYSKPNEYGIEELSTYVYEMPKD